jgi:hypothetical protein
MVGSQINEINLEIISKFLFLSFAAPRTYIYKLSSAHEKLTCIVCYC